MIWAVEAVSAGFSAAVLFCLSFAFKSAILSSGGGVGVVFWGVFWVIGWAGGGGCLRNLKGMRIEWLYL